MTSGFTTESHSMPRRTLYLLRHATAEPSSAAPEDYARQLSALGRAQAEALGAHLQAEGFGRPAFALCSGAARTRETFSLVSKAWGAAPETTYTDRLYHASTGGMLAQIQELPAACACVLVVGHNPGIHLLAAQLGGDGDAQALDDVALRYAPGTMSVFHFESESWEELAPRAASLSHLIAPESLQAGAIMGAA